MTDKEPFRARIWIIGIDERLKMRTVARTAHYQNAGDNRLRSTSEHGVVVIGEAIRRRGRGRGHWCVGLGPWGLVMFVPRSASPPLRYQKNHWASYLFQTLQSWLFNACFGASVASGKYKSPCRPEVGTSAA